MNPLRLLELARHVRFPYPNGFKSLELDQKTQENLMLKIIKWIIVPALAIALLTGLDAPKAEAGNGFSLQIGGFGISSGGSRYSPRSYGHSSHYRGGNRGAINRGGFGYSRGFGVHGIHRSNRGGFHDTTHLDYHPPQLVPHGNHFDVQPGHYDVHRTGHWHN